MKKISSLFVRDYEKNIIANMGYESGLSAKGRFLASDQVTPGCEWVIAGEGVATRKWDGTAVLFMDGWWFKRYDAKAGKTPPASFFEAQPEPDPITGHWPGWVPVNPDEAADRYIYEAIQDYANSYEDYKSGETFEAIGPKINGNKENYGYHTLKRHGNERYEGVNPMFTTARDASYILDRMQVEGIVFHHPDGRMCKVKRSDFGLKW